MADFKLALVTGASSGIGEQLCRLLAKEGISLIISARRADKLNQLARELSEVEVSVVPTNLADPSQRKKLIKKIAEKQPDLVINNAGWGYYGEVLTYETEKSMDMFEVNAAAVLELSIEAARVMVSANKKGVILNVSSAAAFQEFPSFAVYAATKAFVNHFSGSFDQELRPYGVRVLSTCPGMVDTEFRLRASDGKNSKPHSQSMSVEFAAEEIWRQIKKRKPLHIFDWRYRVLTLISRLIPKKWVSWILRKNIEKRVFKEK